MKFHLNEFEILILFYILDCISEASEWNNRFCTEFKFVDDVMSTNTKLVSQKLDPTPHAHWNQINGVHLSWKLAWWFTQDFFLSNILQYANLCRHGKKRILLTVSYCCCFVLFLFCFACFVFVLFWMGKETLLILKNLLKEHFEYEI